MVALRLSVPVAEVRKRMQDRLRMPAPGASATVVWRHGDHRVVVLLDSLTIRFLDGWLLCNIDLQADETGKQTLQIVYFLGTDQDAAGVNAACTINATTVQGAQLADLWGADLQRILWDTVLDAIEVAVEQAAKNKPGLPLTIQGFGCTSNAIQVAIIAGDK